MIGKQAVELQQNIPRVLHGNMNQFMVARLLMMNCLLL